MAVIQAFNRERAFRPSSTPQTTPIGERTSPRSSSTRCSSRRSSCWAIATAQCSGSAGAFADEDADDRDAHLVGLHAQPRVPASAGAVGSLRPGAVAGAAMRRSRSSSTRSRRSGRAELDAGDRIEGDLRADRRRRSPTGASRCCTDHIRVPAGGCLHWWASRAAASRRPRNWSGASTIWTPARSCSGRRPARAGSSHHRRQLGVVLQDPFLFAGTIADDIRFARPEATDDEVEDVARMVGLDRSHAGRRGPRPPRREGGAGCRRASAS